MERDEIVATLNRYFATEEDVLVVYLFGSTARGQQLGKSDIDVGVLFGDDTDEETRLLRRIEMGQALQELMSHPVDVVDLRQTPPHFNHQVLRHKVVIKGHAERDRIAFEKDVRRQYFDMLHYRQRYMEASLRRLREGGDSRGRGGSHQGTLEAARRIHQRLGRRAGD